MTDRLLLAVAILGGLVAAGLFIRVLANRRNQSTIERVRLNPDPESRAGILVFSGPGCSTCQTQQRIVDNLVRTWPHPVTVRTVDTLAEPDLAGRLGILVIPTTVVTAPDGRIVAFNGGLVESARLTQQLHAAA